MSDGTLEPEPTIDCIDCGGVASLMTTWDDENPPRPGDLAVYRCRDCNDRWDMVLPGEDAEDGF